ncbi:UBX domain-containing protein [Tieghemostelium lacteum]|uniref:UBX domain-containing protein n=1 Tax=Tieghemostelium lacteum TaxID=361077 RepID=A0A152A978_TIELA|nr:UBX domain-containing protein [Tieghemostelium lacteum]|eukprot:KYR02779.1 UBX domain-containing protein [Tieghemostelium lacteum]
MSLHILYRSQKNTIQVLPNNSMAEILEKGCKSFRLNEQHYTLQHNGKPVNLSLPFRLSGIPNQSRVSIVEKTSSTMATVKQVNIAIQLSDGKRYTSPMKTSVTLWDILLHFEEKEKLILTTQFDAQERYVCPVFNLLNKEIKTLDLLQSTTLLSLHVTESVLIKLSFQPTSDLSKDEVLKLLINYKPPSTTTPPSITTPSPPPTTTTTTTTTTSTSPITNETISPSTQTTTTTTTTSSTSPINNVTISPPTQTTISPNTSEVKVIPPTVEEFEKPIDTSLSEVEYRALVKKVSEALSPTSTSSNSISPNWVNIEQETFKFPTSTTTTTTTSSSDSKMDDLDVIKPEEITVNRNLRVYVPVDQDLDISSIVHDDKLSEEDFKRLQESNKREKKAKEEDSAVLKTKYLREKEFIKKMSKYSNTVLRVYFPTKQVLEMTFSSHERVSALVIYLKSLFTEPQPLFYLYTTPPYTVLHNFNHTLLKEGLIPNAKIYLGFANETSNITFIPEVDDMFLKANQLPVLTGTTIYKQQKDQKMFDSEATTITTTTTTSSTSNNNSYDNDSEMKDVNESTNTITSPNRSASSNQSKDKIVPKWFTMGKK